MSINANSTCNGCSGANVTLIAYASSTGANGLINLAAPLLSSSGSFVHTGGSGAGNNGNITLIAGGNGSSPAVSTGTLDATGGSGTAAGTGVISIATAQPVTSNGQAMTFNGIGQVTSANVLAAGTVPTSADILITGDLTGNSVKLNASGNISTQPYLSATVATTAGAGNVRLTPNNTSLYVLNPSNNTVTAISTATNSVIATIAVGSQPVGIAISPDGSTAYVTNTGSNDVSVIDLSTNTVVATIPGIPQPKALTFNGDGSRVFVASNSSVIVIDTSTRTIVGAPIAVGPQVQDVVYNRSSDTIYISNFGGSQLTLLNPKTLAPPTIAPLSFQTFGNLGVCPCGTKLLIPDKTNNQLVSFSTETNSEVAFANAPAGLNLTTVAVMPNGGEAYVGNASGQFGVIQPLTSSR